MRWRNALIEVDAPGRIRTCDPRIRSPPLCLQKRRFSRLFKPNLGHEREILLSENSGLVLWKPCPIAVVLCGLSEDER